MPHEPGGVITSIDVRQYFQNQLSETLDRQGISVRDETVIYLTNLLTGFTRTDTLYDQTRDGVMIRPLAAIYGEAVNAASAGEQYRALQRLGDLALFISGLFAHSLSRSLVDVDYYIAMGGNAYGCLASTSRAAAARRTLQEVFAELAGSFVALVDVLAEIGEQSGMQNSNDVLRLYEIWLASGSPRAAARLRQHGIEPVHTHRRPH